MLTREACLECNHLVFEVSCTNNYEESRPFFCPLVWQQFPKVFSCHSMELATLLFLFVPWCPNIYVNQQPCWSNRVSGPMEWAGTRMFKHIRESGNRYSHLYVALIMVNYEYTVFITMLNFRHKVLNSLKCLNHYVISCSHQQHVCSYFIWSLSNWLVNKPSWHSTLSSGTRCLKNNMSHSK